MVEGRQIAKALIERDAGHRLIGGMQCRRSRAKAAPQNDDLRRLVWTAQGGLPGLAHYNGAVQVYPREMGGSRVVWTADVLPDEAAAPIGAMMREGAIAMTTALRRLAEADAPVSQC